MDNEHSYYVLHQSVDLAFDFDSQSILGKTCLTMLYKDDVVPSGQNRDASVHLHCRQSEILEVYMCCPVFFVANLYLPFIMQPIQKTLHIQLILANQIGMEYGRGQR